MSSAEPLRVVFLIEDSLPNSMVGPELTPTLWSLIGEGGWHRDGGVSVLASSTYPNHASFVTGTDVVDHRIFTNDIWNGDGFVCSSTIGPVGDTIFHAARRAGVSTSATLGDQTMVGVMGAQHADVSWPPAGTLPPGTATDCLGYAANSAVLDVLGSTDALDAELAYVHFNDPDSTLHLHGPDSIETRDRLREIDDDLEAVVEMLRPRWDETVLFVVSDHEQETIDRAQEPLDMVAMLHAAGMPGHAHNEGTIAVVVDGVDAATVGRLPDITGAIDLNVGVTLAWSGPGRVFGRGNKTLNGQHGSPRTRTQVAAVSGGHSLVGQLSNRISGGLSTPRARPHATDWAPLIAELFRFELGDVPR